MFGATQPRQFGAMGVTQGHVNRDMFSSIRRRGREGNEDISGPDLGVWAGRRENDIFQKIRGVQECDKK